MGRIFVDRRLDFRCQEMLQAIQDKSSVVVHQLAANRSQEMAFHRFLRNPLVYFSRMIQPTCQKTSQACQGRDVLLIADSSAMGFGLRSTIEGLGAVGDGRSAGFYFHPLLAVDAPSGQILGLASAQLFDHPVARPGRPHAKGDLKARKRERNRQVFEDKLSYRWYAEVEKALKYGRTANRYTVVADREADIYDLLVKLTQLRVDYVIRSFQNRLTEDRKGPLIQQLLDEQEIQGRYEQKLPATDRRSAHTAELQVKWLSVDLARPHSGSGTKHLPAQQAVTLVEVRESAHTVVGKEAPIYWRLLTSHTVETLEQALLIVDYYRQRWVIEQLFRTIKKKGLDLASIQLEHGHAVQNMAGLVLISAVQIMQLVQARDRSVEESLPIQTVFEPDAQQLLSRLSPTLEGRTEKQKNPHPAHTLAFAAWVIARLGGWKGYASERPPGPMTMLWGMQRFMPMLQGARLMGPTPNFESDV